VTEEIKDREKKAYMAKGIRERKIRLGIIKEEVLPIVVSKQESQKRNTFLNLDGDFKETIAYDLKPTKIKTEVPPLKLKDHSSLPNFRNQM
jgi:hypothetical protein